MREIIFRGLRTDGKGWVYGSFLKELYNSYIVECVDQTRYAFTNISVIPETVGQFTGLTDSKGNKVFEGDIVQTGHHTNEVRYIDAGFVFYGDNCLCYQNLSRKNTPDLVIGNIHDTHLTQQS